MTLPPDDEPCPFFTAPHPHKWEFTVGVWKCAYCDHKAPAAV